MKRLEAVVFDWAGTTVDHGSLAPVRAVTEMFLRHGIQVSDACARRDMGIFKKDHIRRILAMPHVETQWVERTGGVPGERDLEELFSDFTVLQTSILNAYSQVIAGVPEASERLRSRGIKIASTTGYTRPMLDMLITQASSQGYTPTLSLCPEDVSGGRPYPWICLRIALELRLSSTAAAAKIGDTANDIEEGLNAGMWTVGVAATGNDVGLSAPELAQLPTEERCRRIELAQLPTEERCRRIELARAKLFAVGAHYVVDSVAVCEQALLEIDARIAAGERP